MEKSVHRIKNARPILDRSIQFCTMRLKTNPDATIC